MLPVPLRSSALALPTFDSWEDRVSEGNSPHLSAMHDVCGLQSITLSTNWSLSRRKRKKTKQNKTVARYWLFFFNLKEAISTENNTSQWPIWSGIFHDRWRLWSQCDDPSNEKQRFHRCQAGISTEDTQTNNAPGALTSATCHAALTGLWPPHTHTAMPSGLPRRFERAAGMDDLWQHVDAARCSRFA